MSSVQRKRPAAAGRHRGHISTASHYEGRFLEEVLNGSVFSESPNSGLVNCTSVATSSIPLEFCSLDEYVGTFDPLVLEEAREEIRSGYLENAQAGLCQTAIVSKLEEVGVDARDGTALASSSRDADDKASSFRSKRGGKPSRSSRPHVRVTITSGSGNNSDLASLDLKNSVVVFEFVPVGFKSESDGKLEKVRVPGLCVGSSVQSGLVLKAFKTCTKHRNADNPPCAAWMSMLRSIPGTATVTITKATQLTSSEREFDALHAAKNIDSTLIRYILKPSLLISMKEIYETKKRQELWPREAGQEAFVKFLKSQYDRKQLEAIEMTACQLSVHSPDSKHISLSTKLPFVLIQGPPGTGKTHTVCGVLNVWHLTAYQQHYNSLIRSVKEASATSGSGLDSVNTARRWGLQGATTSKPRILVCTPSNAACDELMARVMMYGFCDGRGNMYRPNVVRIGGDAAVDNRVRERFLGTLVKAYTSMTEKEWHHMHQAKQTLLNQMKLEVRALEASMGKASESEMNKLAESLIKVSQDMEKVERQVEKLAAAWPSIVGGGSAGGRSGKNTEERRSEEELKTLLLSEAEMVFSTLSSTQQKIFRESCIRAPFHTVLIDEAGQASEVAALQPMTAGAKSIVLVGDPQQLPATIKSEAAKAVEMERSLFERLQTTGCPVALLSVQYRMHPEIRRFPSQHFYGNLLEDAPSVSGLPPEAYHAVPSLGPYQVFDVASGREERSKTSSLSNPEEARLAVCLYMKLRKLSDSERKLTGASTAKPVTVAIITPYRQQRTVLRQTFRDLCGGDTTNDLAIETIDSYQGRQVDVVILSCVRAGTGGGLGFVNDVRRMNVAITRARRSLWILGALETLKRNKEWGALVADAEARGVVVPLSEAHGLLHDELVAADEADRKKRADIGGSRASVSDSRSAIRAPAKRGEPKKTTRAMNVGIAPREVDSGGSALNVSMGPKIASNNTIPMKRTVPHDPAATSGTGRSSTTTMGGIRPMEKPKGRHDAPPSMEGTQPKPMKKEPDMPQPDAGVADSERFAGTMEGRKKLEKVIGILQRQIDEDPFDPAKPKATKGRTARRKKRKAKDRAEAVGSDEQFLVSSRFPQLPPDNR